MIYSQTNIEQLFELIGSFPGQEYRCTDNFDYIDSKKSVWTNQLINLRVPENEYELEVLIDIIEEESEQGVITSLLIVLFKATSLFCYSCLPSYFCMS